MSEYPEFQVIMTDVYKSRSREVFIESMKDQKDIILETPFNNENFKDFADLAKGSGYRTYLVVLFLNSPSESFDRVAARHAFEGGLDIPKEEVSYNFTENMKNVAKYYFYFDEAVFIYTGQTRLNQHVMTFTEGRLVEYKPSDLDYIQRFAGYAHSIDRMESRDREIIAMNAPFISERSVELQSSKIRFRP